MEFLSLEWWEGASYVVTVIGLPMAIGAYFYDQARERQNEEEEIFQYLSEEYSEFQKVVLKNADLRLNARGPESKFDMTPEQNERKIVLYDILISLFERAYLLVYEDKMDKKTARLWASWDDYMHYWCQRSDFIEALDDLLQGEDPEFSQYMMKIAEQARSRFI